MNQLLNCRLLVIKSKIFRKAGNTRIWGLADVVFTRKEGCSNQFMIWLQILNASF